MIEAGILDGDYALVQPHRDRARRRDRRRAGAQRGSDAQVLAPRERHDPARSGQRRLRSADLPARRGPGAGQARGAAAALSLSGVRCGCGRRASLPSLRSGVIGSPEPVAGRHQPCSPWLSATLVTRRPSSTIARPPVSASIRPSALSQRGRQLQRQPAVGDDDVGALAGRGERALLDPLAAAAHQHLPVAPAALERRRRRSRGCSARPASRRAAPARPSTPASSSRLSRVNSLRRLAQHQQALALAGDPDMAAVARDQQVGHRRRQQQHGRERRPAPARAAAPARATAPATARRRRTARTPRRSSAASA